MSNFQVGDRVVCINDEKKAFRLPGMSYQEDMGLDGLTSGVVYVIRDVFEHPVIAGAIMVRLVEITRPPVSNRRLHIEAGFHVGRFRPVVDRKTDISLFQAMLTRPRLGVRV